MSIIVAESFTPSNFLNAATCTEREASVTFSIRDYDLAATLESGQAFRWKFTDGGWNGVVGNRWVRLRADEFSITAESAVPVSDWHWLTHYLQLELDLSVVVATFPDDEPIRAAVA